jgi:hypothetical protein
MLACAIYSNAVAVDSASVNALSEEAKSLSLKCNLEARNALIHGDVKLVEQLCMDAVKEIEKSSPDKELTINPLLNLAYTYTLAGLFDKATPLYERARGIGEKSFKPGSQELKKIDEVIKSHEEIVRMENKK